MGKDICIVTGEEVSKGYRVIDDPVIETLRKLKKALGRLQNNRLYVSEGALEEYNKRRKEFEKMVFYASITLALFFVLLWVLPLVRGDFETFLKMVIPTLVLAVILSLLLLLKYVPRIEDRLTVVAREGAKKASSKPAPKRVKASKPTAKKKATAKKKSSRKAAKSSSRKKKSR